MCVFSAMGSSWRREPLLLPLFFLGWAGGLGLQEVQVLMAAWLCRVLLMGARCAFATSCDGRRDLPLVLSSSACKAREGKEPSIPPEIASVGRMALD